MERLKVGFLGIVAGCLLWQVGAPLVTPAHAQSGPVRCQLFETDLVVGGQGKVMEKMAAKYEPIGAYIGASEPVFHNEVIVGGHTYQMLCVR